MGIVDLTRGEDHPDGPLCWTVPAFTPYKNWLVTERRLSPGIQIATLIPSRDIRTPLMTSPRRHQRARCLHIVASSP